MCSFWCGEYTYVACKYNAGELVYVNSNPNFIECELDPTGINTVHSNSIQVFPNPADDYIVVDFNTDGNNGIVLLSIIDLNGKPVFAEVQNEIRNQRVIKTRDWKAGVYLVTISVNGSTIKSRKLTIK
jgi:hypothetical protein